MHSLIQNPVPLFHTDLGPAGAPALLLVHGWGGDGREWSPHAEALAGRFRVVVPDLRGHGRSPVPEVHTQVRPWEPYGQDLGLAAPLPAGRCLLGLTLQDHAVNG
ncbi:alpha/beta fold hydrolase [Streptomyces sp. HC307]|uniref:alpha/beta fold hydrolase n=1 Tax=Streptomyces flavusporus TaxID=3385496 RepID=UPI0039170936